MKDHVTAVGGYAHLVINLLRVMWYQLSVVAAVAPHLPDRVAVADGRDVEQAPAGRPRQPVHTFLPGVCPLQY